MTALIGQAYIASYDSSPSSWMYNIKLASESTDNYS